ncbi:hypothetical protein [Heyndrickxia sporothermodurans]|uniref:hypothetical protein n=1 Tax=Heyndrickxia sporothermodurans TaxID=46224 RepID=UPI000D3D0406|nr:hypothetical protein [Heyndrickxia sporothermodurans]PTY92309.1 hypothetical protein B5V90_03375 [Heyndrickxia sporothermodurans]
MKSKNLALGFISILLIGWMLSACSKGFSIEGVWDVVDNKGNAGSIDFNDNGTFSMRSGAFEIGGNYSFDDEKLSLIYPEEDTKNYEVELIDNESIKLYSIDENGDRTNKETIKMEKSE